MKLPSPESTREGPHYHQQRAASESVFCFFLHFMPMGDSQTNKRSSLGAKIRKERKLLIWGNSLPAPGLWPTVSLTACKVFMV